MQSITLHCLAGPLRGQTFHLEGGPAFIFGRYGKADFSLAADPATSHLHFLVDISDDRVRILDLGSTNGIVVNETPFGGKHGPPMREFRTLESGDTILAGSSLFRLTLTPETAFANIGELLRSTRVSGSTRRERNDPGATQADGAALQSEHAEDILPTAQFTPDGLPIVEGYTILERIGGGGKGVVYKAVKEDTGATAAVKMMSFGRNRRHQRSLQTFRREIQITKQLDHPNVVRYLGDGIAAGAPYLAIEYVDGGTLDDLVRNGAGGRMELPEAVPLFIQLLEAVAHMHARYLVHRDIKPKNVLLDLRGGGRYAAKLSDMGLSCRFSEMDAEEFFPIVTEGGTLAYMPPEQMEDLSRAIPQSDVFSAAATLYQMLSGKMVYDFAEKEEPEAILEGRILPVSELRPELPRPVAEVIGRGLSYSIWVAFPPVLRRASPAFLDNVVPLPSKIGLARHKTDEKSTQSEFSNRLIGKHGTGRRA